MTNYLESLWCALYCSDHWYQSWMSYKDNKDNPSKRMALKHKAIAILEFDRILVGYNHTLKNADYAKNLFVYHKSNKI